MKLKVDTMTLNNSQLEQLIFGLNSELKERQISLEKSYAMSKANMFKSTIDVRESFERLDNCEGCAWKGMNPYSFETCNTCHANNNGKSRPSNYQPTVGMGMKAEEAKSNLQEKLDKLEKEMRDEKVLRDGIELFEKMYGVRPNTVEVMSDGLFALSYESEDKK